MQNWIFKGTKSTNSDSTLNSETESKLIPSPAERQRGEKKLILMNNYKLK